MSEQPTLLGRLGRFFFGLALYIGCCTLVVVFLALLGMAGA